MNLTPRQLDVAAAIRNHRHLRGFSPTMDELAEQFHVSKPTIFEHLGALERKGVIRRNKHMARSIELVSDEPLPDESRPTKLPLFGDVAAGSPVTPTEDREELDLETLFRSRHGVYVLRVRGEAMIEDHLCDGDYVIVERRESVRSGEQVVALVDGTESTLKRFYKETGGRVRLQPANKAMTARVLDADRVKIVGVVIGLLRSY